MTELKQYILSIPSYDLVEHTLGVWYKTSDADARITHLEELLRETVKTFETAHHNSNLLKRIRETLQIEPPWYVKQHEEKGNG